MIRQFLKDRKIKTPDDLNNLFKNMMKDLIEECYQGEIKEELGYTRYDYRNGDYEPQLIKKYQNTIG